MDPCGYPLLPRGVRDHLPGASARLRAVQEALRGELGRWGYEPIITPLYEYLEVLERGLGAGLRQQTFKFVEPHSGEVVALRPDITPQVARLYATRYAGVQGAVRLCYEGRVVRFARDEEAATRESRTREVAGPREVFQVGVELLGCGGPEADAEVISLLAASLEAVGLSDFQIDIGQVEVTRGVLAETTLAPADRDRVVRCIARKDRSGLEALLGELRLDDRARRALVGLVSLYGGPDVLCEAARVIEAPAARAALEDLTEVVTLLAEDGYADRITVDLGELRDFDYHDGILFHAFVPGVGVPLAGGGRYDHLAERYGRKARATGFAVDVEQVVAVLDRNRVELPEGARGVLVHGPRPGAMAAARALRRAGLRASRALGEEDVASAARLGFAFVARVVGPKAELRRLSDGRVEQVEIERLAERVREG
jgi:ATP phosphoribosyltransferase regulatory subunit